MGAVGCQKHPVKKWKTFSRDDVSKMARNGAMWYDTNWTAWMALLDAYQNVGTYNGKKQGE